MFFIINGFIAFWDQTVHLYNLIVWHIVISLVCITQSALSVQFMTLGYGFGYALCTKLACNNQLPGKIKQLLKPVTPHQSPFHGNVIHNKTYLQVTGEFYLIVYQVGIRG